MNKNNIRENLKSIFSGAATGAVSGIVFGSSVEFLSDLFQKKTFILPEILFNGFLLGTIPACAMAGSAYLGTKILNEDNNLNSYAATYIGALIVSASLAMSYDIGSTHDGFVQFGSTQRQYNGATLETLAPLLKALSF